MRKIRIVAVGRIKEKKIQELVSEYSKRISPYYSLEIVELKDEGKKKESVKMGKYLNNSCFVLDEKGNIPSSIEFAGMLKEMENEITFIIGGHEGITEEIKRKAKMISLSSMTFTHEMCRLFLAEQIYRACMINNNREYYHK